MTQYRRRFFFAEIESPYKRIFGFVLFISDVRKIPGSDKVLADGIFDLSLASERISLLSHEKELVVLKQTNN